MLGGNAVNPGDRAITVRGRGVATPTDPSSRTRGDAGRRRGDGGWDGVAIEGECSCRAAGRGRGGAAGLLAMVGLAALAQRRRRRR